MGLGLRKGTPGEPRLPDWPNLSFRRRPLNVVRNLALEIEDGNHYSLSVMGLSEPDFERDRSKWGKVDTKALRVSGPRTFGYAPDMSAALDLEDPDLVHVHGLWIYPSVAAIRWSRLESRIW